jgi:hypothetical protein
VPDSRVVTGRLIRRAERRADGGDQARGLDRHGVDRVETERDEALSIAGHRVGRERDHGRRGRTTAAAPWRPASRHRPHHEEDHLGEKAVRRTKPPR